VSKAEKQIHLWRAEGKLKGFVCPGGRKRSEVNELLTRLHAYEQKQDPEHPFNCLLLAEPGWGKSSLARSVANHFEFSFLEFSVAQMGSNQDLKNSLRQIVSEQNQTDKCTLVFVDEIDAQIESHTAMGLLLDPIWSGTFMADGSVYRIKPCVWVFASTRPISRLRQESKGRDFLSRINGPIINLDFFEGFREELDDETDEYIRIRHMVQIAGNTQGNPDIGPLRTEMVYYGVHFLNKTFGPISSISEAVLRVFYNTMPINGIRSIAIFASRFHDISRGRVSIENVPKEENCPELERHIRRIGKWPTKEIKNEDGQDSFVKVIANPPK